MNAPARSGRGWAYTRGHVSLRTTRLATGLVLFAYVTTHLLNHALGNVSFHAMEAGLEWVKLVWRNPPAGMLLYGALAVHVALALWALYARPRFLWTPAEAAQLLLGLALPPLLVGHVVSTRLAYALSGSSGGYAHALHTFYVAAPGAGLRQALALVLAWAHGCVGLYLWLRLKPWFPRLAPALLCLAVLIPVLALLGFVQGGRTVAALAAGESWRIENVAPPPQVSPEIAGLHDRLAFWRMAILGAFGAGVILALGARFTRRALEHRRGLVRITYADGRMLRVPRGTTVLEASRMGRIPHASVCGGRGRCSTCRVRVFGGSSSALPSSSPAEEAVLRRIGAGSQVRLACQLRPQADIRVAPLVAPSAGIVEAHRVNGAFGEERFVVAMFVDMRGSTRFAEMHLPYDTVFVINRFLDAVSRAVVIAGGTPNQFLGDGLLALFGLQSAPPTASREALAAVAGIGLEVAALNKLMEADVAEPIRFGIGVHAGTAILGEIGGRASGRPVFTAIGDPVNVAARLQTATKRFEVEAVISDAVFETAGEAATGSAEEVAMDGRAGLIRARAIPRAAEVLAEAEPVPA